MKRGFRMTMRTGELLEGLPVFIAVADARSFTQAAKRLGISPSAASQAVRGLEARIGAPLLNRSTRSISLTPAGEMFLADAGDAFTTLEQATRAAVNRASLPSGPIRLTMPKAAYDGLVATAMETFAARYPAVAFEVEIEGALVDLAERGLDAGFRYGRLLGKDMASLEVLPASRAVLVAAPRYLDAHEPPTLVEALGEHRAVVCRSRTTGVVAPWRLQSGSDSYRLDHAAPTIAGDLATQIDLTLRGFGVSCAPIQSVAALVDQRRLQHVLPEWAAPLDAIHLYYPRQRARSAALIAFIAHLNACRVDGG